MPGSLLESFPLSAKTIFIVLYLLGVLPAMAADSSDPLFPRELVHFTPSLLNPLMLSGPKGAWDEQIRERGWIMKEGERYRMWYTGFMREGVMRLGHATSKDGLHWQRDNNNPLYSAHWVEDVNVVKHEGRYYMFAEGLNDRAHLLASPDGLRWTRLWRLDIRQTNNKPIKTGPYGTPVGWHEDGVWYLLYERNDLGLWLARSADMKVWTNVQDEPVFVPGPEPYDDNLIAANQVIKYQGRYYLYYHGRGNVNRNWNINVASSTDLIHWTKYEDNPLLPAALNVSSGIVVHDGDCFRLYTTHQQVDVFFNQMPCATSP